jgi:hypothetical protein
MYQKQQPTTGKGYKMDTKLFIVKYAGSMGFMRPYNAVFTKFTRTETFITPSRLEGIQRFLKTTTLTRAKVSCESIFSDQCSIRCPNPKALPNKRKGISTNGMMLKPTIFLGFEKEEDANTAFKKTICLRTEDILWPIELFSSDFDSLSGCEFIETGKKHDKFVGIHRYNSKPMYGKINITNYFIKPEYE